MIVDWWELLLRGIVEKRNMNLEKKIWINLKNFENVNDGNNSKDLVFWYVVYVYMYRAIWYR